MKIQDEYNVLKITSLGRKERAAEPVLCTPDMARAWRDAYSFSGQRSLRPDHIAQMSEAMSEGRFEDTPFQFAIEGKNPPALIDGNNRLHAIIDSDTSVWATISVRRVESAALSYSKIDRGRTRTAADAYAAMQLAKRLGISNPELNRLHAAVRNIHNGWNTRIKNDIETTARWCTEYVNEYKAFLSDVNGGDAGTVRLMYKGDILGVALLTYRYSPMKARRFWIDVSHDDGLAAGDPAKALSKWILVNPYATGGRYHGLGLRPMPKWGYAKVCADLWRKSILGEEVKTIRSPGAGAKFQVVVEDTPYDTDKSDFGISDYDSYGMAAG